MMILDYNDIYEKSWLKCRLLSFFDTSYYDDVVRNKPKYDMSSIELIAVQDETVVGLLDISINTHKQKTEAMLEVIAVHPDFQGQGIATELLDAAVERLTHDNVSTLEVWTREDEAANHFYEHHHFTLFYTYYHVYGKRKTEPSLDTSDSVFLTGFYHVLKKEELAHFSIERLYECRGYKRSFHR